MCSETNVTISSRFGELTTKLRPSFIRMRKHCFVCVTNIRVLPYLSCLKWPRQPYIPPLPNVRMVLSKKLRLSSMMLHDLMSSSGISTLPMGRQMLRLSSSTIMRKGMKSAGLISMTNDRISNTKIEERKALITIDINSTLTSTVTTIITELIGNAEVILCSLSFISSNRTLP